MSIRTETKAAESLLGKHSKITASIGVEVGKLSAALAVLTEARRSVEDAAAAEILGTASDTQRAQKSLDGAQANVDRIAGCLRGLRRSAATLAESLAQQHKALGSELPGFHAQVRSDFEREWNAAVGAFSRMLGQRKAIEELTGSPMTLQAPKPANTDISDLARPKRLLDELGAAVQSVGAVAPISPDPRGLQPHFDPSMVYRLRIAFNDGLGSDLQPGALVVADSFADRWTELLVRNSDALPVTEPEHEQAQSTASAFTLSRPSAQVSDGPTISARDGAPIGKFVG